MKRASYRHGVRIIALNDDPEEKSVEAVRAFISVNLLADLFGVDAERVAEDVVKFRVRADRDRILLERRRTNGAPHG